MRMPRRVARSDCSRKRLARASASLRWTLLSLCQPSCSRYDYGVLVCLNSLSTCSHQFARSEILLIKRSCNLKCGDGVLLPEPGRFVIFIRIIAAIAIVAVASAAVSTTPATSLGTPLRPHRPPIAAGRPGRSHRGRLLRARPSPLTPSHRSRGNRHIGAASARAGGAPTNGQPA